MVDVKFWRWSNRHNSTRLGSRRISRQASDLKLALE
jgi:hypothetical protein